MKVSLPSNGILGISTVDLREPTFRDIRSINQMNQQEDIIKAQFTKALLPDKLDFSQITKQDLDYLFLIAAFSTQLNVISYSYTCTCGNTVSDKIDINTLDVVELKKYKLPYRATINSRACEYSLLSAQQHLEALDYSINHEDFEEAYHDYCVSKILNIPISDVDALPVQVYASALLFQKANFHGVKTVKSVVCPHCSRLSTVDIHIGTQVVSMDLTSLMEAFDGIKDNVDFQSFLDFTSAEYKAYQNILEVNAHASRP